MTTPPRPVVQSALRSILPTADGGFSAIAVLVSLVVVAVLAALLLSTAFHGSGSKAASVTNAPGVHQADDASAHANLSTSLTAATGAAAGTGFGSVTPSVLNQDNPSVTYTSGDSTGPNVVSVASATTDTGGALTLAAWSSTGTCWLIWQSTGGAPWYGAQIHTKGCHAPAFTTPPSPGAPSATAIGWKQGSFPTP